MHHLVVERWSRGTSPLHTRDARAKLGLVLAFLVAVSTAPVDAQLQFAGFFVLLTMAAWAAGLPLGGLLARAALVLPFSGVFALMTWWSGDPRRALALAEKSFLSGLASLLLVATSPLPVLLAALDSLRVPRLLILVIQFLYRYLFAMIDQARNMRHASLCRRGAGAARKSGFRAAAGALGVLFARSWERADGVYRSMLARGFRGRFAALAPAPFGLADLWLLCAGTLACAAVRFSA